VGIKSSMPFAAEVLPTSSTALESRSAQPIGAACPPSSGMRRLYRMVGSGYRARRAQWLKEQFGHCRSVLDLGGTFDFWLNAQWKPEELVLLNLDPPPTRLPLPCTYHQGDALAVPFPEKSFYLAFSNSVIEHVPDQAKFASEMLRLGKRVYCQTPSRWCPIEPHYLTLFFHWLPRRWFTHFVHRWLTLQGLKEKPTREDTAALRAEINLLGKRQLRQLFPGCKIRTEWLVPYLAPKSYVVTRDVPGAD